MLILGAVKGGLRVKGGVRAWGLVVAPWCVYIRCVTQASVIALPGRDRWVEGI